MVYNYNYCGWRLFLESFTCNFHFANPEFIHEKGSHGRLCFGRNVTIVGK